MTEFYAALGVAREATSKEIKDAYRRLARQYHPDVNPGDKRAEEKFKEINEAYHVLSVPQTRKDYDQYGSDWKHAEQLRQAGAGFAGARSGGYGRPGAASGGFDGIFSRFGFGTPTGAGGWGGVEPGDGNGFGYGPGRAAAPEVRVEVTLSESFTGATRLISFDRHEPCSGCGGSGRRGRGRCASCQGAGGSARQVRLEVKIPSGIEDGGRVRIRPSADSEIILAVTVKGDPRFRREGADLHTTVEVPYLDVILGGEARVPTMTGQIALKIPAGTVAGRTFRIAGKGMPRMGGGEPGSLYATVAVTVPQQLSEQERKLLEQLRAAGHEAAR